ncbi:G2/M B-type cyclin Cdc13 [Paramicrosporidium saccamoebae]|uniref:G2/M B-type cyclin Cdc13 n=1 Tax=Paramicrosporidium saccamoebae TaxID=1246581 RepID=A0A2H9TNR5_9FUNG|nr:G2/M B-type cyclin Cdc13 [Paramicrosporidium saccamoebae]
MFDTLQTVDFHSSNTLTMKRPEELEQDENADKRFGAKLIESKGLAALAGSAAAARRNISGPAARNLRSTTLQTRAKVTRHYIAHSRQVPSRSAGIVERACIESEQQLPTTAADKENIAPNMICVPSMSMMRVDRPVERDWDDLDAEDAGDPLMVSEYVKNIMPQVDYMENQKELNWHARSVLIDWLVEVQWKLKLLPETLFLSVNIIDRFLSKRSVSLVKLQLVGMAATLLASKYEEVLSPSIANLVYLAENAYDEQELLKAERYMLHVLAFSLAYPSPLVFLRRISKAEDYDVRSRTLAKYLMELCLLDLNFVSCPPSMVAAVSIFLAREMLKSGPWVLGEYSKEEVQQWADVLIEFLKKPVTYEAVYKKYALKKMMKASLFVADYMKRNYNVPLHTLRDTGKSVFSA